VRALRVRAPNLINVYRVIYEGDKATGLDFQASHTISQMGMDVSFAGWEKVARGSGQSANHAHGFIFAEDEPALRAGDGMEFATSEELLAAVRDQLSNPVAGDKKKAYGGVSASELVELKAGRRRAAAADEAQAMAAARAAAEEG